MSKDKHTEKKKIISKFISFSSTNNSSSAEDDKGNGDDHNDNGGLDMINSQWKNASGSSGNYQDSQYTGNMSCA